MICENYDKYLGLSILIGRSKYNMFHWIKERVWSKIINWKHKFISQAGREILIKAVLQALPIYPMSVFLFQKNCVMSFEACWLNFDGVIRRKNSQFII